MLANVIRGGAARRRLRVHARAFVGWLPPSTYSLPAVSKRLVLGPMLLLMLLGLLWLDEWLSHIVMPMGLRNLLPPDVGPNFARGLVVLIAGLLIVPIAARELGAIFQSAGVAASRRMLTLASMSGLLVCAAIPLKTNPLHAVALVATVATCVLVSSMLWHIRDRQLAGATAAAGAAMFAFIYLGLMFGFVLALRREHSAWVVLGVLVVAKSCDIGAYFTGKALGRRKLIPWLSPGKTWEGLVGGVLTSALVAVGAIMLARSSGTEAARGVATMPIWLAVVGGGLLGLLGQAGDLLESILKRDAGVKDSGKLIPGFGGVLDVLDSILLAAPVAFWLLTEYKQS
jgi:phosphatidate cytidylyltransferase